jgi:AcrR family transcriptional regulator
LAPPAVLNYRLDDSISRDDRPMSARTGRRAGDSGTREAILDAARARFAAAGYDRATIRQIAADAGVDAALVHHYYESKEKLFVAATRLPAVPSEVLQGVVGSSRMRLGENIVRTLVVIWDDPHARESAVGLLRSALTNENAARMLREFVTDTILSLLAQTAEPDDGAFRASLVASQVVGLLMARFVLELEPLASATIDELVPAVGPSVQRYLTGNIRGRSQPLIR